MRVEDPEREIAGELKALWAETMGDPRIRIAVLDGPVDLEHPAFQGARIEQIQGRRCGNGAASRHGTHVASLLFGQHGRRGVQGVAPRCSGLIVPIFDDGPGGDVIPASQSRLAEGLDRAIAWGAHVVSISAGQPTRTGRATAVLADAVRRAQARGALIVAAAGNGGCECMEVPGVLPQVLVVGALGSDGEPWPLSNWNGAYRSNGIVALGENVPGARAGGGTLRQSGTSFATPLVAGVAALLMTLQLRRTGRVDAARVKASLLNSAAGQCNAEVYDCRRLLAGRLNVRAALTELEGDAEMDANANELENMTVAPAGVADANEMGVLPACAGKPDTVSTQVKPACACQKKKIDEEVEEEVTPRRVRPSGVLPHQASNLVYVVGQPSYDFGSEANRDSFVANGVSPDLNPASLLQYVQAQPYAAESVTWLVRIDNTPIYAVRPAGAFAPEAYARLREFLRAFTQADTAERTTHCAVAGRIAGDVQLLSGQRVPVVVPDIRGMANWNTGALTMHALKTLSSQGKPADKAQEEIANFLNRVFIDFRNTGRSSRERALNFAATNLINRAEVILSNLRQGYFLDDFQVVPSTFCRPDSDCWDVRLTFYKPAEVLHSSRRVVLSTIDVSEALPVEIGPHKEFFVR